ncbi:FAD-linked oxidase C-terminal domain-containing protein, partial [Chloroflexota bacterium]
PTGLTKMQGMDRYMVMIVTKGRTQKEIDMRLETIDEMALAYKGELATGPAVDEWVAGAIEGKRHREMGAFASAGRWVYYEYFISRSQVVDCHHTMRNFIYGKLDENNIQYLSNEGCVAEGSPSWIITVIIWTPGHDKKAAQVVQDIFYEATELACSRGWYPDCHQGYGTQMMAKYWPKGHYDFMRKMNNSLDPNNIMNPGLWDL